MNISGDAVQLFKSGFNCSQSVFTAYAVTKGVDKNLALKISRGFGSGMGRLQETCGAVTGAYMAISLSKDDHGADEMTIREDTYSDITQFTAEFKNIYGTTNCMKILGGCNLSTDEGQKYFKEQNLKDETCTICVKNAADILQKFL